MPGGKGGGGFWTMGARTRMQGGAGVLPTRCWEFRTLRQRLGPGWCEDKQAAQGCLS